jgi:hypothetical protein
MRAVSQFQSFACETTGQLFSGLKNIGSSFLGRIVCCLSAETVGAMIGSSFASTQALKVSSYINESLPLQVVPPAALTVLALSAPMVLSSRLKAISQTAFLILSINSLVYFSAEERHEFTASIFHWILKHIFETAGTITGGFVGLAFSTTFDAEFYFKNMVNFCLTGIAFDLVIKDAGSFPGAVVIKTGRLFVRTFLQNLVYNHESIGKSIRAVVTKKSKKAIIPLTAEILLGRFGKPNILLSELSTRFLPFFNNSSQRFFSKNVAQPLFNLVIPETLSWEHFLEIVAKTLNEYTKVIEKREIQEAHERYTQLFLSKSASLEEIETARKDLIEALSNLVSDRSSPLARTLGILSDTFVLNEQTLSNLSDVIVETLKQGEIDLIGIRYLNRKQWAHIHSCLQIYSRSFLLYFLYNASMQSTFSKNDELVLILATKGFLFSAIGRYILPQGISQDLNLLTTRCFQLFQQCIHLIVPPQSDALALRIEPFLLIENYGGLASAAPPIREVSSSAAAESPLEDRREIGIETSAIPKEIRSLITPLPSPVHTDTRRGALPSDLLAESRRGAPSTESATSSVTGFFSGVERRLRKKFMN